MADKASFNIRGISLPLANGQTVVLNAGQNMRIFPSGNLITFSAQIPPSAVQSVTNADGTLTISPTIGNIVASINLAHANTWTGKQTFNTSAPLIGTATASTIAGFDASKNLITLATATYPSLTELSYVKGVTSAIQTQINAKGAGTVTSISGSGGTTGLTLTGGAITTSGTLTLGGTLAIANGGTGAATLAGAGIYLPITADLTSQTAAVTSIVTVTAPNDAVYHTYQVGAYLTINSIVTDVIQAQVSYTDENGASQTQIFSTIGATPAISLSTVGAFVFASFNIRAKFNTAIIIKSVLTTGVGSINYDVGGTIQRLN